jgi:antirestriction protein
MAAYADPRDEYFAPECELVPFPHADIIDSRDIIEVLESDAETFAPDVLADIESAESASPDWAYGATLIADGAFVDYARELADDIGAINDSHGWPLSYIDWDAAADALKMDYTSVEIDGETYWVR